MSIFKFKPRPGRFYTFDRNTKKMIDAVNLTAMHEFQEAARDVRALPKTSRISIAMSGLFRGRGKSVYDTVRCPNCDKQFASSYFHWVEVTPHSNVYDAVYVCPDCGMEWLVPNSYFGGIPDGK
jgi:DNA-directed RNA polymerase subunit RPC12/RpoP